MTNTIAYLVQSNDEGLGGWGSHIKVTVASTPEADKAAAEFFARATRYTPGEAYNVLGEVEGELGDELVKVFYPLCEHNMNWHSCYGPQHFMSYEQERREAGY